MHQWLNIIQAAGDLLSFSTVLINFFTIIIDRRNTREPRLPQNDNTRN
jgi:hypothetical protein